MDSETAKSAQIEPISRDRFNDSQLRYLFCDRYTSLTRGALLSAISSQPVHAGTTIRAH